MTEEYTYYDANTFEALDNDELESRFNSYIDSLHPEVLILQYSFNSSEVLKNASHELYDIALNDHINQMLDNEEILTEEEYSDHVQEVLESFTDDLLGEVMAHTSHEQDKIIAKAMKELLKADKLYYERDVGGRYTLESIELNYGTTIVEVLATVVAALKNVKE